MERRPASRREIFPLQDWRLKNCCVTSTQREETEGRFFFTAFRDKQDNNNVSDSWHFAFCILSEELIVDPQRVLVRMEAKS